MDENKILKDFFNAIIFSLLIISIKFKFSDIVNKNPLYHIYTGFMFTVLNSIFTGMGFVAGVSIFIFIKKKLKNERFSLFVSELDYGKGWIAWY